MNIMFKNFYGSSIELSELKFLFLFCPNNSGTTIMSQYLAAQIGGYLPPFGHNEGQMMPAVRDIMRNNPWAKGRVFDWVYIRKRWESLVSDRVFVEASPPNLIRVHQLEPIFGSDSSALISVCDPYQHIASSMRQYSAKPKGVAKQWVFKAKAALQVCEAYPHFPFVSYEQFVENPAIVNEKIGAPFRNAKLAGKRGSSINGIASAYCRSMGFLKPGDVVAATEVLESATDILKYFGYSLIGPEFLGEVKRRNPDEFGIGLARREKWDQRQTLAP